MKKQLTINSAAMFSVSLLLPIVAGADDAWRRPFKPDKDTVVLYHFDEGQGNVSRDAMGDKALTLHARIRALWGKRAGFGSTARFDRLNDHLMIGPTNNDKLQLRTCTKEWTIEAWVRYTGSGGKDRANSWPKDNGYIFANICGSDEEGAALPGGYRHGWIFYLRTHETGPRSTLKKNGILPGARFFGSHKGKDPNNDVGGAFWPGYKHGWLQKDWGRVKDHKWHHYAWQFRYRDQTGYMFVDGKMTRKVPLPGPGRAASRIIVNNGKRCDIPFQVGGFLRPDDRPDWKPSDFNMTMYNLEGEIDELRISKVMRFPIADKLAIIRQKLPDAGLKIPYRIQLGTDAAQGKVRWKMMYPTSMPKGLKLDPTGVIHGTPSEQVKGRTMTILARDASGATDKHTFVLTVAPGRIVTESLPTAFKGMAYQTRLESRHMRMPLRWEVVSGSLPLGVKLHRTSGELKGTPPRVSVTKVAVQVTDANGTRDRRQLVLRALPAALSKMTRDRHTVALYDWQGPNGRLIAERVSSLKAATLAYTNMGGDRRYRWPGRIGRFPQEAGHGEHGYCSLGTAIPALDMKTCSKEWTVEAWVRRGGPYQAFADLPLRKFDYGHVCGTYDKSEKGVWELYLSEIGSPKEGMAPGIHFQSADYTWKDLHPWKRPKGIVAKRSEVGIADTEWHHIAWQYSYKEDLHQLFLDGKLIWQMKNADGRKLVNNRKHDRQFSVFSRLGGRVHHGGDFNYLGFGNFFGQVGEIRISSIRRYGR